MFQQNTLRHRINTKQLHNVHILFVFIIHTTFLDLELNILLIFI